MSRRSVLLLVLLAPILALVLVTLANPLRWPLPLLENYILGATPIGTSFEGVLSEIETRGWKLSYASREHGFLDQRTKPETTVGSMSVRASLGDYQGLPFMANVTVFWGFDLTGKLADIWVWKTWDGI